MVCHPVICQTNFVLGLLFTTDRQDRGNLNIPSCRIAAGQRNFYYRGVKIWNSLNEDLKKIADNTVFKKRLTDELICDVN